MKNLVAVALSVIVVGLVGIQIMQPAYTKVRHDLVDAPAPEFTHTAAAEWLNSEPLSLSDLRGQVVLVDFWTFGCWNCYRSFPWLNALQQRVADRPVKIIGVHTPEFEHEHDVEKIASKVKEFGLEHPVMIDSDYSYWNALKNRYWPAFYLIDKHGVIRHVYAGETHDGDSQSRKIGSALARLAKEPYPAVE